MSARANALPNLHQLDGRVARRLARQVARGARGLDIGGGLRRHAGERGRRPVAGRIQCDHRVATAAPNSCYQQAPAAEMENPVRRRCPPFARRRLPSAALVKIVGEQAVIAPRIVVRQFRNIVGFDDAFRGGFL